jgi:type VI secretion system protein ImpM
MIAPIRATARASVGFFGKLPSRGDFVRAGLPSSFVAPWDSWMSRMLRASQASLGRTWRPAWLEAPVWNFALQGGVCGPDSAVGLWMPSVDAGGRSFALVIAAVVAGPTAVSLASDHAAFLASAAQAGLDAIADDLPPDTLAARIAAAWDADESDAYAAPPFDGQSGWWTDGAPFVPRSAFGSDELPDDITFVRMLHSDGSAEAPTQ